MFINLDADDGIEMTWCVTACRLGETTLIMVLDNRFYILNNG
jgi:hypothetical protein